MKKGRIFRLLVTVCGLVMMCTLLSSCWGKDVTSTDALEYEGETYVLLEYPTSIVYYDYNGSVDAEEDEICLLESSQWAMVWYEGDVYCIKDKADEAKAYYANEANYDWFAGIDEEKEVLYPLELTVEEIGDIYDMAEAEWKTSIFFEEIESFGNVTKVSKDGMIKGIIGTAKYDGQWYWRTETIDENREKDGTWAEYICPLPEPVNDKIKDAKK